MEAVGRAALRHDGSGSLTNRNPSMTTVFSSRDWLAS